MSEQIESKEIQLQNNSNSIISDDKQKSVFQRYMFDTFLIKEFLDSVKEGNLEKIQNYIGII